MDISKALINKFSIISIIILSINGLSAQKTNAVYAEFGGNAIIYSINYDFAPIRMHPKFRLKAGASFVQTPFFIAQANYLFGREKHFFELGVGVTTLNSALTGDQGFKIAPNAALQYRFEHPKGFLLRIGFAPVYLPIRGDGFEGLNIIYWVWPGISLGYAF